MEFDPLSRDVAPPRHEIESDSEDEVDTVSSTSRRKFTPPQAQLVFAEGGANITASSLVVFQSEGAEAFLRAQTSHWPEVAKLMVNEEQQGSLALSGGDTSTYILLLRPSFSLLSDQGSTAYICSSILSEIKPNKIIIVDDYNPSLYLSEKEAINAPIRYLSSSKDAIRSNAHPSLELFEAPNYVVGLGAAMMNECHILGIPSATLLLLPRAINSHLQSWSRIQAASSSLDTQPDLLEADLSALLEPHLPPLKGSTNAPSSTQIDLQHFLHTRRSQSRRHVAQSVSAMYV